MSKRRTSTSGNWTATASNCLVCDVKFGLFTRRHHCRTCGDIFCNNCSSLILDTQRCCQRCYDKATNTQKTNSGNQTSQRASTATKRQPIPQKQIQASCFSDYEGTDEDVGLIAGDGLVRYFTELGIVEEPGLQFCLFWKIGAMEPGEINETTFNEGWGKLGGPNMDNMKQKVAAWKRSVSQPAIFDPLYAWTFDISKENEDVKYISPEAAVGAWEALLPLRWDQHTHWQAFLEQREDMKIVTRDMWTSVGMFSRDVNSDGSNWDELDDGSWSSIIDEYVEYLQSEGVWSS